jgi:uncharacterized protein YdhG (YjbR/CyaY superfamily)
VKAGKSRARSSAAKGRSGAQDVDQYLARVPEPARSALKQVRATIRSVVPSDCTEGISYGIPAFRYKGRALVGFAAFTNHCSLFPMGSSAIAAFKDELKDFQTSKGTIRFTVERPLPVALLKKVVKARVAQNNEKKSRALAGPKSARLRT